MLSTAADSPKSNDICGKMVGMIKEGIKKVNREEGISRQMGMMWTMTAKNCLSMKNSFSANQLVFGRNTILPNLMRENISSSLKRGGEEGRN